MQFEWGEQKRLSNVRKHGISTSRISTNLTRSREDREVAPLQFLVFVASSAQNRELLGIDFRDVVRVFDGDTVLMEDDRFDYDESRFAGIAARTRGSRCAYRGGK